MRLKSIFIFLFLSLCFDVSAIAPGKIPNVFGVTYGNDAYIRYGAHEDTVCGFNSDQGDGGLTCGLSATGQFFLIMDKADLAVDTGVTDIGTPQFLVANSDPTKWVSIYHNGTNAVIHTNTGVVTFPEGLDLGSGNMSFGSSLVFEGATADSFETTLTVVDPTADRTVTIPNQTGATILSSAGVADTANAISGGTGSFIFEGATADSFETTLTVTDPTADQTITLPNATGVVHTSGAYAQFSSASPTAFSASTGTLTPTNNFLKISCNRAGPADTALTLDETGATIGQIIWVMVDGTANNAGTCSFADVSNVQQTSGRTLDDWDTISFVYTGAEWVELGGVNN